MIVLTPNPRYRFTIRDESPSDEAVIRETWVENVYQIHEGDLVETGVLVDIGANIGAVSVYAASLLRPYYGSGRIIAVEPEPDNLTYLTKNLADNGISDRVQVCAVAVSKDRGHGWIVPGHGHSTLEFESRPESTEVSVVTLADIFDDNDLRHCDVLKMDVEGAEYDIIAGADLETLWRIKYLTLEFDAATDAKFGTMIAKLAKVFNLHIIGSPARGGYIYGRRY